MRRDHGEGRPPDAARGRLRPGVHADLTPAARFVVYGTVGLVAELAWTGLRGRPRASVWMFPVYGGAQLAFEPVHDALRPLGATTRACAYGAGFTAWEYATGRALRGLRGAAPWDYSHARLHVHGLIRAGYVPVWACAGLAYERVHDALTR